MDFPFAELTHKGHMKVNEGHMESLFDRQDRDADFYEDHIMRDIACLSSIGTDFYRKLRNFDSKFSNHFFESKFSRL